MEKSLDDNASVPLKVGLTYNLKHNVASEAEDEEAEYDSEDTVYALKKALEKANCQVTLLEATEELPLRLRESRPDIVFNIAEGTGGRGREAQVPAVLNMFRIPYTGSDETTLCIALDKALTKRLLTTYHVKTPKYQVISKEHPKLSTSVKFPVIVKPNAEGSSKGISDSAIVFSKKELDNLIETNMALYKQDMLVEEYIEGREFTVGILGNGKDRKVFLPMEIIFLNRQKNFNIYSYQVKINYKEYVKYECPAKLDEETETKMMRTAGRVYEALNCKDFARVDFRLSNEGEIYFIEINPLPGLAPDYSDFPMIAEFNGMGYDVLVREILNSALKRHGFICPASI